MYFILTIFVLFLSSFSYSMQIIDLSPPKKVKEEIKTYFNETLSKVKLSELAQSYHKLSDNVKNGAVRRMSYQACLLHAISLCMPQDIQKYIYAKMLLDTTEAQKAVNAFWDKMCMMEAFSLCNNIVKVIDFDQPVAPLFILEEKTRNNLLIKLSDFSKNSFDIMISNEEVEGLNKMPEDLKQYFEKYEGYVADSEHIAATPLIDFLFQGTIKLCALGSMYYADVDLLHISLAYYCVYCVSNYCHKKFYQRKIILKK